MAEVFGMTPEGFRPKRMAEILADMHTDLEAIVDPATGQTPFLNVTDDSIIGQVVAVVAEAAADCWNAAYEGSVQFDPLKNSGAGQSGTVQLNAILRKPGVATMLAMAMTGNPGVFIPANSMVSSTDGLHIFNTVEDLILDVDGAGNVAAVAQSVGDFVPDIGAVTKILTPAPGGGWFSAINVDTLIMGTNEETDEELRMRQQRSTSLTSYRLIDAIYAATVNIPGVLYARAFQNALVYPEDERGIPFKEVALVVEGGDDKEIAEMLFLRLPTGQVGFGSTTVTVDDLQGFPNPISFSRPQDVEIYVDVDITITDRMEFPENAPALIQQAIMDYAQYGDGGNNSGFPPGVSVVRTRLFTPINTVPGFSIANMTIGLSLDAMGKVDIPVEWNEVARFDPARINVRVL